MTTAKDHPNTTVTVTERFAGTMLAGVHVDTYSMLNGDAWGEMVLEHYDQEGEPSGYDDYDWTYDHTGIVREFAQIAIDYLVAEMPVIVSAKLTDVGSPAYYNFTSDWFDAEWTIDLTALDKWLAETGWDLDAYVEEHHESRDGFFSYARMRLNDPYQRPWFVTFLKLDAYVRAHLNVDDYNSTLWEAEYEVYDVHVTITPRERETAEA